MPCFPEAKSTGSQTGMQPQGSAYKGTEKHGTFTNRRKSIMLTTIMVSCEGIGKPPRLHGKMNTGQRLRNKVHNSTRVTASPEL
jgi:hypothetical protein